MMKSFFFCIKKKIKEREGKWTLVQRYTILTPILFFLFCSNKHLDLKKITKNNARSEIFSISLKRSNQIKEAKQQRHSSDIGSIARQLKHSLSKATQKLNGSHSDTPSVSNSDWPIKKPQLLHLQLLKQYLTFVSCETKTIVNKENNSIQFTFNEQENKAHPSSHLGAAMIEHLVHNNNTLKRQSNEGNKGQKREGVKKRRGGA